MQRKLIVDEVIDLVEELSDVQIIDILNRTVGIKFIKVGNNYGLSYKDIKESIRTFPLSILRKMPEYENLIFRANPKERIEAYKSIRAPEIHYTPKHVLLQLIYMRDRNIYEVELKNEIINEVYKLNKLNINFESNELTSLLLNKKYKDE